MEASELITRKPAGRRRQHTPRWDLALVMVLTLAAMAVNILGVEGLPRVVLGLLLSMVLPGYGLAAAMFPQRSIESLLRLMLVPGLSLALGVAGGMLLFLLPWGMWPHTWAVFMGSIALGGSLVGLLRHYRQPLRHLRRAGPAVSARHMIARPSRRRSRWAFGPLPGEAAAATAAPQQRVQWFNWLMLLVSALLVASAMYVARGGWDRYNTTAFTQLWAIPEHSADGSTLRLGLHNQEGRATTYQLRITAANTSVYEQPSIALGDGARWETTIPMPDSEVEPLVVLLYRQDQPDTVYRRAEIWPEVLKEQ